MRKWSMSVASVLCVLSATAAAGQSRPPTVDELVQVALERNRDLLAAARLRDRTARRWGLRSSERL